MRLAIDSSYVQPYPRLVRAGLRLSRRTPLLRLSRGWSERWTSRLREWHCLLTGGHSPLLHTDANRISLRCVGCGHQSPGWEIDVKRPAARPYSRAATYTLSKRSA